MRVLKRILDSLLGTDAETHVDTQTMFGHTLVYDTHDGAGDAIRVLDIEGTWQSASYTDGRWASLVFQYHRHFDEVIFGTDPSAERHMLMLGGGALSYAKHVVVTRPEATIDVIEIDPIMTELARRYFYLDRLKRDEACRLNVTHADAAAYLVGAAAAGLSYDVIINDAFAASDAPHSLASARAAASAHALLSPAGIYVANVVSALRGSGSLALSEACSALEEVFEHVFVIPLGTDEPEIPDNNIVVGTDATYVPAGALPASELPLASCEADCTAPSCS